MVYKDIDIQRFEREVRRVFDAELASSGFDFLTCEQIRRKAKNYEPSFPDMVQVGVTNICNMSCPECYHRIYARSPIYHPIYMKLDLFKRIVDEVQTFPHEIVLRFLGRGESLLHPDIFEMISYSKSRLSGPIAIITNGHLLSEGRSRRLLDTKVDIVDISVDAVTPNTYSSVRGNGFINLEENIKHLVKLRNERNSDTKIMVSFTMQMENYTEAMTFKTRWTGIVDKVIFRKYHSYAGRINEKPGIEEDRYPCAALWSRVNINEAGKITLCYVDWDETYILADLNQAETTILGTWRSAYNEPRNGHIKGKYPDLCRECKTGWEAAHWVLSYERAITIAQKSKVN